MRTLIAGILLIIYMGTTVIVISHIRPVPKHEPTVTQQAVDSSCNSFPTAALKQACRNYQSVPSPSKYMIVFDMTRSSLTKRLYIIDMQTHKTILQTYGTHGANSGNEYVRSVSNVSGSLKSSRGLMITGGTYIGKHGRSIHLIGLERGVNNNVYSRQIVIHSAWYAKIGGKSWGCIGVPPEDMPVFLNYASKGVLVYAYF